MLPLMDGLGGCLLWVLLFRRAAWTDESDSARQMRLTVASLTVGFVLGLVFYAIWPGIIWFSSDKATKAWFAFAGLPLIVIALTFLVESLNNKIR